MNPIGNGRIDTPGPVCGQDQSDQELVWGNPILIFQTGYSN